MTLVKLRRPPEITEGEKDSNQYTKRDHPNSFDYQLPKVAKIESVFWLDQLFACTRQHRAGRAGIRRGNRFMERLIDHKRGIGEGTLVTIRWRFGMFG